ncbi:MAG: EF-P lysine aminoacylase GenX [Planctomycetales bacterium]|nr:EF-P lysine aminoacylase GenX [Planctomycetales bacterium]
MNPSLTWLPSASPTALQRRGELLWKIREFFYRQGLLEVHTPVLSHDTVIDRHIDPIALPGKNLALPELHQSTFYLQSSPEFCMKRLLAAGLPSMYQIAPVFRAGERGDFHNPEFTMIEWYRLGDDLQQSVHLLAELLRSVLAVEQVDQQTYQQVFQRHTGCDPLACSVAELAAVASERKMGVDRGWSDDRDDWLNLLFSEAVQPELGAAQPLIVTHYPASQSALARVAGDDPRTAERYELFIGGVELANGYHELLDAGELEQRNHTVLAQRAGDNKTSLPGDSRLLAAMRAGLPACSGCALGFDRLLMVVESAAHIDQVLAFPIERA